MRRIITLATLSLSLLGGGAAMAANRGERVERERVEARVETRDHRPEARFERHEERSGFRWVGGEWMRHGRGWSWRPGHYERLRAR
jgi:hypothetical protein